jgi:hypothetical protein
MIGFNKNYTKEQDLKEMANILRELADNIEDAEWATLEGENFPKNPPGGFSCDLKIRYTMKKTK